MKKNNYRLNTKGQTLVYYGDGKGKTTAALGGVLRATGHGWQCAVFQFIKGPWPSGERDAIKKFLNENVTVVAGGKGFVGIMGDKLPKKQHKENARKLFLEVESFIKKKQYSKSKIQNPKSKKNSNHNEQILIVLDELLDAIDLGFIKEKEVIELIKNKPENIHMIITGHKKYPKIFAEADLVTEMKKQKHPFDKGFLAIRGLDY